MKHKNILTLLMMGFCIVSGFSQVPSYVPTSGLVGWWPFNGNANDESGAGNNGTVNGATLTKNRFGDNNQAYLFDGNDNITLNAVAAKTELTVSFWTYNINTSKGGHVITQSDPNDPSSVDWAFEYLANTSNHESKAGSFKGMYNTSCTNRSTTELFYNTLSVNNWNHVVFTISTTGLVNIYLNGTKAKSSTMASYPGCTPLSGNILRFGGIWYPGDLMYFNGTLDDIGIWNRALTQQEITNLYNSTNNSCLPSYVPTNSLVGWWPFCGNANDESGTGNHGTVNGATLTKNRFGDNNQAYLFDGNDNITLNAVAAKTELTVSFWTYNINTSKGGHVITQSDPNDPSSVDWAFEYLANTSNHESKAGSFKGMYNTSCTNRSTTELFYNTLSVNNWNHVVFTISTTGLVNIYLNGTKAKSSTMASYPGCTPLSGNILRFGGIWYPGDLMYFNGTLDDIGIWNRALTQQEIDDLYKSVNTSSTRNTAFNNIKLYPNPASTHLNLDFSDFNKNLGYKIEILNTTGKSLYNATVLQKTVTIDMTTWTGKGLYFVNIRDTSGKLLESKKFVLQ